MSHSLSLVRGLTLIAALALPSCNTEPPPPENPTDESSGEGSTTFLPATGAETIAPPVSSTRRFP